MTYESTYFLTTLADMKEYLGIDSADTTADTTLLSIMTVMTYWMERYTGRKLKSRSNTEYYDGNGTDRVFLKNYPVTSTTSTIEVYDDLDRVYGADTKKAAGDLILYTDDGIVALDGDVFSIGLQNVKCVYTGGYGAGSALVPHDLVGAAFEFTGFLWERRTRKNWADTAVNILQGGVSILDEWAPRTVRHVLDGYRSRRRGL
jgi:hypothetical protein